jgi:hypothetical protein
MQVIIEGQSLHVQAIPISAALIGIVTEQPANSIILQTRNGTAFQIYEADDSTGAFFTVKANAVPFKLNIATMANRQIVWIKTTGGTDTLEVISMH